MARNFGPEVNKGSISWYFLSIPLAAFVHNSLTAAPEGGPQELLLLFKKIMALILRMINFGALRAGVYKLPRSKAKTA